MLTPLMTRRALIFSAVSAALVANSVNAQDKVSQKDEEPVERLIVTSKPLNKSVLESATPVTVLSGEDLESRVAPTLGETLKNVPGVNSSYFGPVSSSPIIRGLDGPRVKILQNGLDASDASRIGPDHVVSTESSNATQIEVLRGPATLLYGSGAIGGVVNVVDNRLPTVAREGVQGNVNYLYDSVSSENTLNLNLDGGSDGFVWHADGFDRETEDYEIPGYGDIDGEGEKGVLENSFIDAQGYSLGMGWVTDDIRLAFSAGNLKSDYGIPGHAHHEEEHHDDEEHDDEEHMDEHDEHEDAVLFGRLKQDRYQLLADWLSLQGPLKEVHFRAAYTDYQHSEIEDGQIGTTFSNESLETRVWAHLNPINDWNSVVGLNYLNSKFSALGDEAFTPASETQTLALFVLQEKYYGDWLWQAGARVERVSIDPDNDFYVENLEQDYVFANQDYTAVSASVGTVWNLDKNQSLAFNLAHSARAPSAAEVFSNGLHIATSTYEIGAGFDLVADGDEYDIEQSQSAVKKETSNNLDITYRLFSDTLQFEFSVFYNRISDYLYQQNTGLTSDQLHFGHEEEDELEMEDGHGHGGEALPVFLFRQQDATFYGFETELDWHFSDSWRLSSFADYNRATLDDDSDVPRIPPLRIGAQLHWENDDWHVEFGATRYASQDRIAEFETRTDGYTLLNAQVNYYYSTQDLDFVVFVKGNNLTDEDARVHASFIKDTAPLPGRSIVLGTKVNF